MSYLFTRMEFYEGPAIITTNLMCIIDAAFAAFAWHCLTTLGPVAAARSGCMIAECLRSFTCR